MTTLMVLFAVTLMGPAPVRFVADHPASARIFAADGHLAHASGFLAETGARDSEAAARAFLGRYEDEFGVAGQELELLGSPLPETAGPVKFARTIGGLPVFGGDLVVGVDEKMRVFLVNSGNAPGMAVGSHQLGEADAHKAAVTALAGPVQAAGTGSIVAGYRTIFGSTRAVYRVDFVAERPAGDWRTFVDGETGAVLFRENLRSYVSAPGTVYEISPVENLAALCPIDASGGRSGCTAPITVTFPNLVDGTNLIGAQTSAYNCNGANQPTSTAGVPGNCAPVAAAGGNFEFTVDSTFKSLTDSFAGGMAYYHLDKHVTFFKTLDPNLPPASSTATGGQSRALRGSLPGLVNNRNGGKPFENAFFSGGLDAMVFGQGANADYSYDATVMYHEFTHGVVFAWGGYESNIDSLGGFDEPGAINEGTADSMAVSETGHSAIGGFIGATSNPASAALRDMSDLNATRSCHGNGSTVTQLGNPGVSNGYDGEVHDDGEIWNGFYWEVFDGLRVAGIKGCSGACEAGPPLQYKTLELAAGTAPDFANYWLTFKSAATALFPQQPSVAAYAGCVAKRRGFDKCDRTGPLFGGEVKAQFIRLRYSPYQIALQVTGPTTFQVCDTAGLATTIYARKDTPVALSAINPNTGAATITADGAGLSFQATCASPAVFTLQAAGTWYLLLDSPNALEGGNPGQDVYLFGACPPAANGACVASSGFAVRPAPVAPPNCAIKAVATTAPHGPLTLTSTLGTGVTWSLASNQSGGSIVAATGLYTAGATANVTDSVQAVDAAGGVSVQDIKVGPEVSVAPGVASVQAGAQQIFTASGGSGTFAWSLATNASGGSVDASGKYTAGSTAGSDVVRALDSDGNSGTASVTVSGGTSHGGGCSTSGTGNAMLLAIAAMALALRRKRES
jgi:MYXO-CTERM domain-containing protein